MAGAGAARGRGPGRQLLPLAVLCAAACSGAPPGDGPASAPPAASPATTGPSAAASAVGLQARLVPYRDDVLRSVLSVQLRSRVPVDVQQVRLETGAFEPGTAPGAGVRLTPGAPVDVRVPYGPARCPGDPAATAVVTVGRPDGPGWMVRLPVADAAPVLRRLQAAACAEREVRRQVAIDVSGFASRPAPGVLAGTLRVRRSTGSDPVRVTAVERSTLLAPTAGPAGGPVLTLAAGAAQAEVPVVVRPARCDRHALAESKRSTVFRVFVAVGEARPVLVLVEPPETDRDALVAFVVEACRTSG